MTRRTTVLVVSLAAVLWTSGIAAQEKLGKVHFPTTCAPAVQAEFDRAVALLHSFWFDPAIKGFTAVAQADPGCGIAHWGVAMATFGNPFGWPPAARALQDGWAAVERAKAAGAKSQRERDYITAVETFYKDGDKVDHRTRAVAYEKAMGELARRYPDDREAAIFHALALNATALPTDKTYANQLKAAAILEKVFAEQPEHPGVAHYLIHSYDYPPIAQLGLPAARRYASIAPSAPHAQHMPSHIFTRRGLWQESIQSNLASAGAAKGHFDVFHAWDYLAYAHLQQAQDRQAKGVLDQILSVAKPNMEHFVLAFAAAAIPSRYALERGQWAEAAALRPPPVEIAWSKFPQAEAIFVFARGLGAARSGQGAAARRDLARLHALRDALTAAKVAYWADQVDIQALAVAGWIARAEGKNDEALRLLRAAADREDATEKHPVTPGPILPARELLGELHLELGQPAEALREFEASHRIEPNRFRGFFGAARAAEQLGTREKDAGWYYAHLLRVAAAADTERPELRYAKTFLGR
jgi:tetratricopeptide (TPR) repeat protein